MHRHKLFQTNQTELKSDKNLGRRSIFCEWWTECPNYTRSHIKSDQPGSHVFRRFLSQLSTDFHEIL